MNKGVVPAAAQMEVTRAAHAPKEEGMAEYLQRMRRGAGCEINDGGFTKPLLE